jgi:outer membrane receptor protein involved in Fe transport
MTTIRTRLLATSMITGLALIAAPAGAAFAADATADASPMATMDAGAGAPAAAPVQQLRATADATAASTTTGEIVVTGSRIPQPNLTSVSPIQAVGHQEFQMAGHTDVVDLLNTLPSNFQVNTADFSNTTNPLTSPGGISTADLRGLGPQRTLVLVNSRRLGIGDPNTGNPNPAPDLDQIPVALIDHVEVLTGGASATYGSDAIAGVVNFIMKSDFEGVQLDGTLGIDQHDQHNHFLQSLQRTAGITPPTGSTWDGKNTDFSVIMGTNAADGKGNVTGYFEFKHTSPITEGDRDFSNCLYDSAVVAPIADGVPGPVCAGSSNSNFFRVAGGPGANLANLGHTFSNVGTSLLPRPQAGSVPPAAFNSSPYEYLSRDDNRYLAGFFAHYEITPWAQPYAEFMFMHDSSQSNIAPSGAFRGSGLDQGNVDVNCNNPLLSAQEAGVLCGANAGTANLVQVQLGRRNVEGGPRTADFEHENYRIVLGLKGDIGDAWHYDGYGSYYYTSLYNAEGGYLSIAGIQNALQVGGTAANPVCLSGPPCVPWNIFTQGGVTPAALQFLTEPGTSHGQTEESIFEFNLTGDLGKYGWKSPWATDGVGIDIGTESRWDRLVFAPDQAELSGDLSGFAGASVAVNNAIGVQEGYFETRIPIAQKQPFAEDLYLEGGVRYSDYSTSGGVTTYKVGGQWSPVSDFTLRGSFDHAIRAASILEAFSPQTVTNTTTFSDKCAASPGVAAAATFAQCQRTGVTAAEYGNGIGAGAGGGTNQISVCPAGQCATLLGGNPNLSPEISDSWSIGGLIRPTAVRGLSLSIDYWDISIQGVISTVPQAISYGNCLNGISTSTFCPNVVRTPQGNLFGTTIAGGGYVIATNQNIAALHTSGIDFQGDYHLNLEDVGVQGWGSLSFHFVGTYQVENQTTTLPGQPTYDCAGLFGPTCDIVNPRWRHTFSLTWDTPWNVLARLQWRYIGETTFDNNSPQTALFQGFLGVTDPIDNRLPAVNYLDLSAAWRVNTILTVRAGVNNILDQDPPLISQSIAGTGAPNAYPTYDLLGRQLFISATAKF